MSVLDALYALLIAPLVDFAFMRRALVACVALALAGAPLGTLLIVRRMSLMGDALAHAVLPGVAMGHLLAGMSAFAMVTGGLIAGLTVAVLSVVATRTTPLREDAAFAGFYIASLSLGIAILSMSATTTDLVHILFGTVLAVDDVALLTIAGLASAVLVALALSARALIIEAFDPALLDVGGVRSGGVWNGVLLGLVVVLLVAGYQAVGTLMTVGLLILPPLIARFWADTLEGQVAAAMIASLLGVYTGLMMSFHWNLPTGPAITLGLAATAIASALLGPVSSVRVRRRQRHRVA
ncbi:MAG: metal ABC transporter permease [Alphaproteobacteria bacterium]|nr:MAG: metal ABC transporter permease [Alphaproteobacteria bacterium]